MRLLPLLALALPVSPAPAQEFPPKPIPTKDAAGKMTLPPGFKVTLFAGEPDVVQPIAFTFDERGRMWVVECVMYPKWSQDGKGGKDRVVILEDTDGDGIHDKKTVVLSDGVNLSGIELGFGGMYLCSSPNLIFVPIKDDKPAGKPEVLLDGWNIKEAKHNVFNGLVWGPDGWLYGCNGIQTKSHVGRPGTPKEKRPLFDCGVWRFHPTRKVFDVVAWGTTNPWGVDWDDHGEMFITNCVIDHLFHFVPGGHYQRMYGQDPNPHTYGHMSSCVDYKHWGGGAWTDSRANKDGSVRKEHDVAGGGHAHSGAAIYLGDNFPKEYRNTLFTANIHGNRLNNDGLERTPTGMRGVRRPDFLFANDPWFRGICVKCGPDGGLYVSDWCDTGECHNYDVADTTNGRIYRVIHGDRKGWHGDLSKLPDAELVKLQLSPNEWMVRTARRILQERAAAGTLEAGTAEALRAQFATPRDPARTLRALWALHAVAPVPKDTYVTALRGSDVAVRKWAVLLAADALAAHPRTIPDLTRIALQEEFARITANEPSVAVLAVFLGAIQRLPEEDCLNLALKVAALDVPDADANFGHLLWFAVQRGLSDQIPRKWVAATFDPVSPTVRRNATRYLITSAIPADRGERVGRVISYMTEPGSVDAAKLAGIQDALEGLRAFPEPGGWGYVYGRVKQHGTAEAKQRADELAVLFGNKTVIAELTARISDGKVPLEDRQQAISLLAPKKLDGFPVILQTLLDDKAIRGAALRALAGFADPNTPAAILKHYAAFDTTEKADAVQTLAARKEFAAALLDAIEQGTIPRADVSVVAARQVVALNDKALAARLEKVWGTIRPASKDRTALIAKWKQALPADVLKTADLGNGRALFTKHCAACHKMFGEGGDTAPELTGSQRTSLDYVFENVLDPSAVVPREYRLINFGMVDGRLVSGIVLKETASGVTVRTVNDTFVLPAADIETRKETTQSIMPEGLLDALKPDEVRDLIAYLGSPKQVPLPKK
jgi:putative membrane-bound dehydrogenase-like protein